MRSDTNAKNDKKCLKIVAPISWFENLPVGMFYRSLNGHLIWNWVLGCDLNKIFLKINKMSPPWSKMKNLHSINFLSYAQSAEIVTKMFSVFYCKTALGKCSNGKFHRWKFCVSAAATAYFAEHLHRILIYYGRTGWQHGTRPLPKWVKEMIMSLLVHDIPVKNTL